MIRTIPARAITVVPSDTLSLKDEDGVDVIGTLYIGVSGDVNCLPWENIAGNPASSSTGVGGAKLFKSVAVGFFPVAVKQVFASGTTATTMIALIN